MTIYAIIAAAAAVLLGVAYAALKIIQSTAKDAGAAGEAKAATEAANTGLERELETEQKQAAIVTRETTRDETVNRLRNGDF